MTLTAETAGACAALLLFTAAITLGGYAAQDRAKQERCSADLDTAQNWLAGWRAGRQQVLPDGWHAERELHGRVEVIRLQRPGVAVRSLRAVPAEVQP